MGIEVVYTYNDAFSSIDKWEVEERVRGKHTYTLLFSPILLTSNVYACELNTILLDPATPFGETPDVAIEKYIKRKELLLRDIDTKLTLAKAARNMHYGLR